MPKKTEKLYCVMDDTIDVGKEPLPIPVELEEFFEELIEEIRSNMNDFIIK